jgi:hypothetical protein
MKQKFQDLIHCSSQLGEIFGIMKICIFRRLLVSKMGGGGHSANFLVPPCFAGMFCNFRKYCISLSHWKRRTSWRNRIKIFVEIKFKRCTILLPGNTAAQTGRLYGCTQNIPGETHFHPVSLYLAYFSLYFQWDSLPR